MTSANKTLSQISRSAATRLKQAHGIEVPHSALKASLAQAYGEHPHALKALDKRKENQKALQKQLEQLQDLVRQAPAFFAPQYDFEGKKLQWLQAAEKLAPSPKSPAQAPALKKPAAVLHPRTLHLAEDEIGCLELLALDSDGCFTLPEDFVFEPGSLLSSQSAWVPKVSRYGLPVYLEQAQEFFGSMGLSLAKNYRTAVRDLQDDSGDSCTIQVQVSEAQWQRVLDTVWQTQPAFRDHVLEWVGFNYKQNAEHMLREQQLDWAQRYLDMLHTQESLNQEPTWEFEWVYPDEDGDRCAAKVDLSTGEVTPQGEVPDDVRDRLVRTRLVCTDTEELYDVYFQANENGGRWLLKAAALSELRAPAQ